MPNLAFSPGPQQPPQLDQNGGEKENASTPTIMMTGAGATKNSAGTALADRPPLELLPAAASGAIVCKRDSSCKCPDCDMAASVFGIDELRRVGGGGAPGSPDPAAVRPIGLVRTPVATSPLDDSYPAAAAAAADVDVDDAESSHTDGARHEAARPAMSSVVASSPTPAVAPCAPASGGDMPPGGSKKTATSAPRPAVAASDEVSGHFAEQRPGQDLDERQAATPVADGGGGRVGTPASGGSSAAKSEGSKKKGWGFRMARAVFSPRTTLPKKKPKDQQASPNAGNYSSGGVGSSGGGGAKTTTAFADEMADEAASAAAGVAPAEADVPRSAETSKEKTVAAAAVVHDVAHVSVAAAATATGGHSIGDGGGMGERTGAVGGDDLLSDDETAEDGECKEERRDEVAADVNDRGAPPVGDTCKPPLLPRTRDCEENVVGKDAGAAAAADPAGMDGVLGKGAAAAAGSMKRSASGRRLSKDGFFECSTEVEHVLTSDSDSDCETDKRASTTTTKTDDQDPEDEHEHEHEQGATSSAQRASVDAVPHPDVEHTSATTRNVNTCADSPVVAARARAPLTPTTTFASGGGGVSALAATAAMPISPVVEANSPPAESEPAAAAPAVAAASVAQHADDDGGAAYAGSETETETGVTKTIPGDEGDEGDEGAPPTTHAAATGAPASDIDPSREDEKAVVSNDVAANNDAEDDNEKTTAQDDNQGQEGGARGVLGLGRRRNRRQAPQLELGMAAAYGHEHDRAKFSQAEVDARIKERLAEEQAAFDKTVSALKAAHEAELQAAADKLQRSSSDGNRAKIAARDAEALEREIAMLSERYGEAAAEAKNTGKTLLEKEALLDAVTAQLMGLKTDLATARAEHAAEKQAMSASADEERRARSLAEGNLQQLEAAYNKLEDSEREKRAAGILKMKNDMKALARQQFAEANKKHAALKARLERSEAQARLQSEAAKEQESKAKSAAQKTEELRRQVEALKKAQADSAASAAHREQLLEEEIRTLREEAESRLDELDAMVRERDTASNGRDVSQDALARMAIRNTQLKESVADYEGKVKELEGFCTEALDELDAEKAKNAQLLAAAAGK